MTTVRELSDRYIREISRLDPPRGDRWGVAADQDRLSDFSPAGFEALEALLAGLARELATTDPTDEPERLGKGFLADQLDGELALIRTGERERWLSNITGPVSHTRSVFDNMDTSRDEGWDHVRARLEAVPAALAGFRETLEAGLAHGRPAARRQALVVAEQCATWAGAHPGSASNGGGWFGRFVAHRGSAPDGAALDRAARGAAAAYAEMARYLREDYAPRSTATDGVGDERYQVWARSLLGTRLEIDEAYGGAWEELARLEREKATECRRIEPGATFDVVRELLINDPHRQVHGVDAYREWLQYLTDEAIAGLDGRQFDIPASIRRCEVMIPPEGSAAAAYYTAPSEDLSRPGRTWFPTVGRTTFPTWDEVSTVYHEAVPGHHLQGATIRLVRLTRAQKLGFLPAHGEGWALYAERLMDELGWFRTPETRLGFLCAHAFRAARIVVDIGLHTGRPIPAGWPGHETGWSYDLAIDYIVRAGGMARDKAESEVLRYLSWPSQATAYKLGERTWLMGREAARRRAGASFDLRRWHAAALALGPLGLDRLGAELERA